MIVDLLIEQVIHKILNEDSYSEENIPPFFFLVLPAKKALSSGLLNYELQGFKNQGISDDRRILSMFTYMTKDMILILPGKETVLNNNLTRFMYDNPDYWYSGDLSNVLRAAGIMLPLEGSVRNIVLIIRTINTSNALRAMFRFLKNHSETYQKDLTEFFVETVPEKFHTLNHLASVLHKIAAYMENLFPGAMEGKDYSTETIAEDLMRYYHFIKKEYEHEGEWLVKDSVFNIPRDTKIILTHGATEDLGESKVDQLKKAYSHVKSVDAITTSDKIYNKWKK